MKATAVIGANFGDEGKGLMTDFLCAPHGTDALVVRFNGGAQAGHTVQTPSGMRHVFHHFGSGTLTGAATFLSRFFVVNPFLWKKERDELEEICIAPRVYVDPDAPLTTPYDMLINQELERLRGNGRYGSCGVGINETIQRNAREQYRTTVADIADLSALKAKLDYIANHWVRNRLDLDAVSDEFLNRLKSKYILRAFLDTAAKFISETNIRPSAALPGFRAIIFEGAQGLLLDEDHRFFPHVTHAKTGMQNVRTLANEMQIDDLSTIYVTRAYMTRHGAGPFPSEDPHLSYLDATNTPNEFQGALRFGSLDIDLLNESIRNDMGDSSAVIAATCLDQVPDGNRILEDLYARSAIPVRFTSYGPSRCDVADSIPLGTGAA